MTADLKKCSERFPRLAWRANQYAANPGAYMFIPRAKHVLPPVVTEHVRIANKLDTFYKNYLHQLAVEKGKNLVLQNVRDNCRRSEQTQAAYRKALVKWKKLRLKLTDALYKEIFGRDSRPGRRL
jgi:hypothetical protein